MMDEVQLKIIKKISEQRGIPFNDVQKCVVGYFDRIANLAAEAQTPITIKMNYLGRISTNDIALRELRNVLDNFYLLKEKRSETNGDQSGDETS